MIGGVLKALILRISGTALWLLFTILVARGLSVEDAGVVFFAISLTFLAAAIINIGYPVAIIGGGAGFWKEGKLQDLANIMIEARWVAAAAGLVVSAALIGASLVELDTPVTGSPIIAALVCAAVIATAFSAINRDTLRSADRLVAALLGQSVIRAIVPIFIAPVFWAFGLLSIETLLVAYVAGLIAVLIWENRQIGKLSLPPAGFAGTPTLKKALGIWPGGVANIVNQRVAGLMIAFTGGLEAAALFLAAERIAYLGHFLTDAVRTVVGPNVARALGDDRQAVVSHASAMMLLAGGFGAVLIGVMGIGVLWAYGPAYRDALPVLLLLIGGQLGWAVMGPTLMILNFYGEQAIGSLVTTSGTVVMILALLFTSSATEAALVVALVTIGIQFSLWRIIRRRLGLLSGLPGVGREHLASVGAELRALPAAIRTRVQGT